MIDLSHWNSATDFTGEAAAALAVGLDPAQPEYRRTTSKPLYERMERHYNEAKRLYQEEVQQADGPPLMDKSDVLESIDLQSLSTDEDPEDGAYFLRWFRDKKLSGFETQKFSRHEVARWLSAIGVPTIYPFDLASKGVNKPLGNLERNTLLIIIAALCNDLGYDYKKAAKTAAAICGTVHGMVDNPLGETTIEGHLKKIPDALATRMK